MYAKKLQENIAQSIYLAAENLLRGKEYSVNGDRVLQIAFTTKLSEYDCELIALAEHLNCYLVSSDKKLLKGAEGRTKSLLEFN